MKTFLFSLFLIFTCEAAVTEKATLAGGCFWGVEELLKKHPGVISSQVGYIGGESKNPTYGEVKLGTTGHAEAVEIIFDPKKTNYGEILDLFFRLHDPTTKNKQGNDVGSQYRSAIFYHSPIQKDEAKKAIDRAEGSKRWKNPVVTEIIEAPVFTPAEEYHQDYLTKNPGGYTCHFIRD